MYLKLSALLAICIFATTAVNWAQAVETPDAKRETTSSINHLLSSNVSAQNGSSLTLAEALSLTLKNNPRLAAFAENIRAKDAAALQAGLLPNPELGVEVENFAGENGLEGFAGAETTIALSQVFELGGKRGKRRQVATLEKDLADWDYQTKKLDELAGTAKAFIQLLAAQQVQIQSEELIRLAEEARNAVAERVAAGKVPPLEQTRAQVELATARTEANRGRRDLAAARSRLAAFWGEKHPRFLQAVGDLTIINPVPPEEELSSLLSNNPDLARWGTEINQGEAAVTLARAQATPDVTLSFGVRNLRESNSNALVAGISVPLPLFDRNQGGVGETRAALGKIRHERRAAETEAQTALAESWQNLSASHAEAIAMRDEILPGAVSAYEAAKFGYREGKFDFLQMLDAQRTLFEVKGKYLQALTDYHLARTEVERLIGAPLQDQLNSQSNKPEFEVNR